MIKLFKYGFLLATCSILLFACKKQAVETTEFGLLNLSNQTTYPSEEISMTYNNTPLMTQQAASKFNNIKIPVGQGKIAFKDKTGQVFLDTVYAAKANKSSSWILFQPVSSIKPIILENNQADEAKPVAGFIKVKVANFAPHIFADEVDLAFYFNNPTTNKLVPADTLEKVSTKFGAYIDVNRFTAANKTGAIFILDSKTKQRLTSRSMPFSATGDLSIFTIYLVEDAVNGIAVNNSTYKIAIKTLFQN